MRPIDLTAMVLVLLALFTGVVAAGQGDDDELPGIAGKTEGLERRDGLLTTYLDATRGKVWLQLPPPAGDRGEIGRYLYVEGLLSGIGSNPIGLDRGQLGDARLIVLRRVGGKLLVEQPNLSYRALTETPEERRAVRESFATSVLWAGEIAALDEDGRALVDLTSFIVRDAHDVTRWLEATQQGTFTLDPARSALDPARCLSFPNNLVFEALLTYGGSKPGEHVRSVTPTPSSITVIQHHSIIRLPDDGYDPRELDPRIGSFGVGFLDYAAPLDRPLERQWIVRHRLHKTDPSAARSPVEEPIVYYVDRGVPEPVRSALAEGAAWWAAAFEAAGFEDAFRVELLPEGAHPLDVRYNVIEWVHRSTRGWSYGGGVVDPRTGEMVKGHVNLGSLRVRQDRLLFEGLLGTSKTGSGDADDPVQLALARIRQLSAHEVGHTLGIAHNFAASTYAGRASVMDYPAPLIEIGDDGSFDTSRAYGVGVGAWDVHVVRWAYGEFPPGVDEGAALEAIVRDGIDRGYVFMSDRDARPAGAAHPLANLWDNGADPVAALEHTLEVRRLALERFGAHNLAPGRPLALLEEVLVPVYFHHRYQLHAAVKSLGGMDYAYSVNGDRQPPARPLAAERQLAALDAVLAAIEPEALDLPDPVIELILPRPFGRGDNRELFRGRADPAFDPLAAAAAAAGHALDGLLQPERCQRLIDFHRRDDDLPGLDQVLRVIVARSFLEAADDSRRLAEIRRVVQRVVVDGLIGLAGEQRASDAVRAAAEWRLALLGERLASELRTSEQDRAHRTFLRARIQRHLERRAAAGDVPPSSPGLPPGDPIGSFPEGPAGCSLDSSP